MKGIIVFVLTLSALAAGMDQVQKRFNPLGNLVPQETVESAAMQLQDILK